MNRRERRGEQGPTVIPVDWQVPAVIRLQAKLQNEKTAYWLIVVITALATAPLGYWLASLGVFLYALSTSQLATGQALPGWVGPGFGPYGLGSSLAGSLVTFVGGGALPVCVIVWAVIAYNRQLAFTTHDILAGQAALMLIDDQYARLIEEERRQHYRLSINPVTLGDTFVDRVNFFAHYYLQFRHLAHGPGQPRIPTAIERNCWLEGTLGCVSGCLNTCTCIGAPLTIPLVLRVLLSWSKQVAIKQAVTDYLIGRHDAFLERLAFDRERGRI